MKRLHPSICLCLCSLYCVPGLGGGHYAPRFSDLLQQRPDVRLGHILASYALDFTGLKGGQWRQAVSEAVTSTTAAYPPGTRVVVYLDRKSFKGADREALLSYLRDDLKVHAAVKPNEL